MTTTTSETIGRARPAARVGWVVDAQNDFLLPPEEGGRLYVRDLFDGGADPGAVRCLPALERAVRWMAAHCDVVVFTGDWHGYGDAEIDPVTPDAARGTYPPHCMGRSDDPAERAGAAIHRTVRPRDPVVLERGATDAEAREAARLAVTARRPVFLHKDRFDVFTGNPATDAFLAALRGRLGPFEVTMAGVARDVCVKHAIEGMLARAVPVTLVTDATWGLGLEPEAESLRRWSEAGAALVTTAGLALRARAAA